MIDAEYTYSPKTRETLAVALSTSRRTHKTLLLIRRRNIPHGLTRTNTHLNGFSSALRPTGRARNGRLRFHQSARVSVHHQQTSIRYYCQP